MKFVGLEDRTKVQNPRAFIYATARNLILDHKRRAKRNDAYVADQLAFDPDYQLEEITPERVYEERERFSIMVETMKTLPRKQQVILTMNRLQGKSYAEIVKETGWSLGDISRNLNAGKAALMDALERAETAAAKPKKP